MNTPQQNLIDEAREQGRREGAGLSIDTFTTDYAAVARISLNLPDVRDLRGRFLYHGKVIGGQEAISLEAIALQGQGKAKFLRYISDRVAYALGKHFDVNESTESQI